MKKILLAVGLLLSALTLPAQAAERVRFVLFTDLHQDLIPGRPDALRKIVSVAEKNDADFLIDLGDLAFPIPQNRVIRDILDSASMPVYHVLGNHDMDRSDKRTYMDFFGIEAPYYRFDRGKFRFIVLDTNFFLDSEGNEHPYANGNYYGAPVREHVGGGQAEWLREQLADRSKIVVIFTHAPLNDRFDRVEQYAPLHRIITEARDNGTRIAAVVGGHNHSDSHFTIDGIHYLQMNSASYIWGGEAFENRTHYPDSVYRAYPSLSYCIPYAVPLYAVFTIDTRGRLTVEGVEGSYLPPAPDPRKLATKPYRCSPSQQSRKLKF